MPLVRLDLRVLLLLCLVPLVLLAPLGLPDPRVLLDRLGRKVFKVMSARLVLLVQQVPRDQLD